MGRHKEPRPEPMPQPVKRGRYYRVELSAEQEQWLMEWWPQLTGRELVRLTGLSLLTIQRIAHGLLLEKSPVYHRRIRTIQRANGRKLGRRSRGPTPASRAALSRYWEQVGRGKRKSPQQLWRERDPAGYRRGHREGGRKNHELYERERRRKLYGLRQESRLRVVTRPYTPAEVRRRYRALQKGYWMYGDSSEEGGERWNIYWDDDTRRSAVFERHSEAAGFHILDGRGK